MLTVRMARCMTVHSMMVQSRPLCTLGQEMTTHMQPLHVGIGAVVSMRLMSIDNVLGSAKPSKPQPPNAGESLGSRTISRSKQMIPASPGSTDTRMDRPVVVVSPAAFADGAAVSSLLSSLLSSRGARPEIDMILPADCIPALHNLLNKHKNSSSLSLMAGDMSSTETALVPGCEGALATQISVANADLQQALVLHNLSPNHSSKSMVQLGLSPSMGVTVLSRGRGDGLEGERGRGEGRRREERDGEEKRGEERAAGERRGEERAAGERRGEDSLSRSVFDCVNDGNVEKLMDLVASIGTDDERQALVSSARPVTGATPLHVFVASYAACFAADVALRGVDVLLDAGADINAGAANGSTALHWAAGCGNIEAVRHLLRRGADPLLKSYTWTRQVFGKASGQLAVHWAAESNHAEVVKLLTEHCLLCTSQVDERDVSPVQLAEKEMAYDSAKALTRQNARRLVAVRMQLVAADYGLLR